MRCEAGLRATLHYLNACWNRLRKGLNHVTMFRRFVEGVQAVIGARPSNN